MIYGFEEVPNGPIEYAYNLDHEKIAEFKLYKRDDYPFYVYFKFNLNGDITEVYPLYLDNAEDSIKYFTGEKTYTGIFDLNKYAYLSWDMKNEPTEIYLPQPSGKLVKYNGENLETRYIQVEPDELDGIISEDHIKFFKSLKADYVIVAWKNDKLHRFSAIWSSVNNKKLKILATLLNKSSIL